MHVRHQIGVLSKVASAFLIPDNHIGRATVSSVAVAHEVEQMGGRSIACLNARDRNLLGFRRDLLTAAAYGVDQFLFVYGDRPTSGARTGQLTVRSMIEELRRVPGRHARTSGRSAPASRAGAGPASRSGSATPTSCSRRCGSRSTRCSTGGRGRVRRARLRGRDGRAERRDGPQDRRRHPAARRCPTRGSRAIERDPNAGVTLACDLVEAVRESGAFDGVHLIPVEQVPRGRGARLGGAARGPADDSVWSRSRIRVAHQLASRAIATVVRCVFAFGRSGMTDASHTRRPS